MNTYIMAIDQGTTSTRAIVFNAHSEIIAMYQEELPLIYPHPGYVEVDASFIWESTKKVMQQVLKKVQISPHAIKAIGITNQRETTVVWDKETGKPIYNGLVWQSRQTSDICEDLKQRGLADKIKLRTGLVTDPYFSGTKVKWILDHVNGARQLAEEGRLLFGTIETWLIWNMTGRSEHITDVSNASRTMLFNINTLQWDDFILEHLHIPSTMLPTVKSSSEVYGYLDETILGVKIPISGAAGDQQAALFGQTAFKRGDVKNTYGTGCFMLMNTGEQLVHSDSGLLTTIAWQIDGKVEYALEGSVFIAGAAIQWLRDGLQLIDSSEQSEQLATTVASTDGVYFVPAFVGLGTPYWNADVRGSLFGVTRGTTKAHIARATLESLAYQSKDLLNVMEQEANVHLMIMSVDGGATQNDFLMQFQSDILGVAIERPLVRESTALGAAYLAGLAIGYWESKEQLISLKRIERIYYPHMAIPQREQLYRGWKRAVKAAICFSETDE